MTIKTIIVDDEAKAIAILQHKIERFCPEIMISHTTQDPHEAINLIEKEKPDLVFLDIAMPELNGFDVLQRFSNPDFEVIFATAHNDFALEAIRHCAIGYLIKPIDNDDLKEVVKMAVKNIANKNALLKNKMLIENLDVVNYQDKKLIIPNQEGLIFVKISDIIHCEGEQGYTKIHLNHQKDLLSSKNVGYFEKILNKHNFYKVHKSHIINLNFVDQYLNEGYVVLTNKKAVPVSRNKRNDFLEFIMNR